MRVIFVPLIDEKDTINDDSINSCVSFVPDNDPHRRDGNIFGKASLERNFGIEDMEGKIFNREKEFERWSVLKFD